MRIASILLLSILYQSTFAQFERIDVQTTYQIRQSFSKYAGDNDQIYIEENELYHLKYNDGQVTRERVSNSIPVVADFIMHDIDQDGDLDIIASRLGEQFAFTFLKIDGKYVYSPEFNLDTHEEIHLLHNEDFNEDGIEDLLIGFGLYVTTGINERQKVFSFDRNENSDYKSVYFLDLDLDGDKDILFHQDRKLLAQENTGGGFSNSQIPLPVESNFITWCRRIKTNIGDQIIYYDSEFGELKRLSFDSSGIEVDKLTNLVLHDEYADIRIVDLDGDGNQEMLVNSPILREIVIIQYVEAENKFISYVSKLKNQLPLVMGLFEDEGNDILVIHGYGKTTQYNIKSDFYLDSITSQTEYLNVYPDNLIDFDGDGYVDIVFDNKIKRYLGGYDFEYPQSFVHPGGEGSWRDYDGDGDADFVSEHGWYEQQTFLNFSGPNIFHDPDSSLSYDLATTRELVWVDVDLDGDDDLFTYSQFGDHIQLYENVNHDTLILSSTLSNAEVHGAVLLAKGEDVDLDGDPDLLVVLESGAFLFKNEGNLNFGTQQELTSSGFSVRSAELADANGDGYVDLLLGTAGVVGTNVRGELILCTGSANGFSEIIIKEGLGFHQGYFANIDTTGWLDVVLNQNGDLKYLISDNGNSWQEKFIEKLRYFDSDIVISDVDSDNDDDILVFKEGRLELYFYINGGVNKLRHICPIGDIYCYDQGQVDQFRIDFGGCKILDGDLFVGSENNSWTDITNINAFKNIELVKGDVIVSYNNHLEDFLGFENLRKIEGSLFVWRHADNTFDGIQKLEYVGGDFSFDNVSDVSTNPTSLSNFESLDTIMGNVSISRSNIQSINAIIQPVFYGDVSIWNANHLFNFSSFYDVDTIYGTLRLDNTKISSLSPFDSLKYVGELAIRDNVLLDTLGGFLTIREIPGNVVLKSNIQHAHINALPLIENIDGYALLDAGSLSTFKDLHKLNGGLAISINNIEESCFSKLDTIKGGLSIQHYIGPDLSLFESLKSVKENLYIENCTIETLNGLNEIRDTLSQIQLVWNRSLRSIGDLHEDLTCSGLWVLAGNQLLNYCNVPSLCRHIASDRPIILEPNGFACSDISQIACNDNLLSGFVFFDLNEDGIMQEDEALLSNIHLISNNGEAHQITSDFGYYKFYVAPDDPITVDIDVPTNWHATTPITIIVDSFKVGDPNNYGNNFGLYPDNESIDMQVDLASTIFVCNREYNLFIELSNKGTIAESGHMEIHYPEGAALDPGFTDHNGHDAENRIITIEYQLNPYFNKQLVLPFWGPSEDFLGQFSSTLVQVYRNNVGVPELLTEATLYHELGCAYDPNDKLVVGSRGTKDFQFDSNDPITYTIRFQNTGNYFAEDVRIRDTLSQLLDISTFEFIQSSHPVEISMEGRVIAFAFEGINLPDSMMDFDGSQGFVMFRIRPVSGVIIGDEIENDAHIYFDFNKAIITNLVRTLVDDLTGVLNYERLGEISVYPNPAKDLLYIDDKSVGLSGQVHYSLYGLSGQLVLSGEYDNHIDISSVVPGMYIIVIENDGDYYYSRVVVE